MRPKTLTTFLLILITTALLGPTSGCIVLLDGEGKVWMDYGHRLEFGHDSTDTGGKSRSEWNVQPAKDLIDGVQEVFDTEGDTDGPDGTGDQPTQNLDTPPGTTQLQDGPGSPAESPTALANRPASLADVLAKG